MTIRILLVDDHSVVRKGLRLFLSYDPELEVVGEAADGAEALSLARTLKPDVVVMDLLMPVMDGWEFRMRQKEDPELAGVPVLVVTAIAATAGIDAVCVLRKPVDVDALLRTVARYCE